LQKTLPNATLVAYLDDIYILSKDDIPLLRTAATSFKGTPITLNTEKSFEKDIPSLRTEGLPALGTFIGPLTGRKAFLEKKLATLATALNALRDLLKQHALLLLRGSIHLLLRHLLRQLDPDGLDILWQYADTIIHGVIAALAARDSLYGARDIVRGLIALPIREGGLGIPNHARLAAKLYKAARQAAIPLLERISPGTFIDLQENTVQSAKEVLIEENTAQLAAVTAKLSVNQERARLENASFLGRQWLRVLPTQKQQLLADPNATEAIRTRLLAPVRPLDTPCSYYGSNPAIGYEDVYKGASR
jgi:hypothetical protein